MKQQPLLMDELISSKQVALASLKQHPGYAILEEMFMAACRRATEDVIKLDPLEEGYERKVKALQMRARDRNEFSLLVLQSIDWHTQAIAGQVENKKEEPEENRIVKGIK